MVPLLYLHKWSNQRYMICSVLSQFQSLKTLSINGNYLGGLSITSWNEIFGSSLKELCIASTGFSSIADASMQLVQNSHLSKLDLAENRLQVICHFLQK